MTKYVALKRGDEMGTYQAVGPFSSAEEAKAEVRVIYEGSKIVPLTDPVMDRMMSSKPYVLAEAVIRRKAENQPGLLHQRTLEVSRFFKHAFRSDIQALVEADWTGEAAKDVVRVLSPVLTRAEEFMDLVEICHEAGCPWEVRIDKESAIRYLKKGPTSEKWDEVQDLLEGDEST